MAGNKSRKWENCRIGIKRQLIRVPLGPRRARSGARSRARKRSAQARSRLFVNQQKRNRGRAVRELLPAAAFSGESWSTYQRGRRRTIEEVTDEEPGGKGGVW